MTKQHSDLWKTYNGRLTIPEIASGIRLCLQNARQLVDDAEYLKNGSRYARALGCLLTADQEIGKVSVLEAMARIHPSSQRQWRSKWNRFRSHEAKAAYSHVAGLGDDWRKHPDALVAEALRYYLQGAPWAERIRQACFYVDFLGFERRWLSPAEVTEQNVAMRLEYTNDALRRLEQLYDLGVFTEEGLRIQQEVLGPITAQFPPDEKLTLDDLVPASPESNPMVDQGIRTFWIRFLGYRGTLMPDEVDARQLPLHEFMSQVSQLLGLAIGDQQETGQIILPEPG